MVLAAQFESFVQPLIVMIALPFSMVGALGGLWLGGMSLNLFSMIGIVLLIGLVTKNSILLIDYANQLRAEGQSAVDAIRHAAPIRMRPVRDDRARDDLRRAAGRVRDSGPAPRRARRWPWPPRRACSARRC